MVEVAMGGMAKPNLPAARCFSSMSTPKSGQKSPTHVMSKESHFSYFESMQAQDNFICANGCETVSHKWERSAVQVLYVDGCDHDLRFTQLACEHCGAPFDFLLARSVCEAIAELESAMTGSACLPDLILLEIMTEGQSGFEVLEFCRIQPQLARIPVVVFTGTSDPNLLGRARGLGATYVLEKEGRLAIGDKLVQIVKTIGLLG